MCKHVWKTINDVRVCPRCGLTVCRNGKIMLDKQLPGILSGKGKGTK